MTRVVWVVATVCLAGTCVSLASVQQGDRRLEIRDAHIAAIDAGAEYAPARVLVRFEPNEAGTQRTLAERNAVLREAKGGTVGREIRLVPGLTVVQLPPGLSVKHALTKLADMAGVKYVEPDYVRRVLVTPNDTYFGQQWGLHNVWNRDIDAPQAWDLRTDANGIIVAVSDTGVDYTHSDLAANIWVNEAELNGTEDVDDDENGYMDDIYGYDFCTYDGNTPDSDPMDETGHGTQVAGIIGAVGNNEYGIAGVCWSSRIMAVRHIGSQGVLYTSDAILAMEYAVANGSKIVNCSYGGPGGLIAEREAIEAAGDAGVLIVAAAGNEQGDNDSFQWGVSPIYPASWPCQNIVAVLATNNLDSPADFTNYGATSVDIGAPGVGIYSTMLGGGIATDPRFTSGTSFAAPHVTGVCALVWSQDPWLTHLEVKDMVLQHVDPKESLAGLCETGGRLNAEKALASARVSDTEVRLGDDWLVCGELPGIGTLSRVRARCFTRKGSIISVGFKLSSLVTQSVVFEGQGSAAGDSWWEYDNDDVVLLDDVYELEIEAVPGDGQQQPYAEYISRFRRTLSLPLCFRVKDSNGATVAGIDHTGNLSVLGTLYENASNITPNASHDEFIFQNQYANIAILVDTVDKDMYTVGYLYENQQSLQPSPYSGDLVFKDSGGNIVAYVDLMGYIYLKGLYYGDRE